MLISPESFRSIFAAALFLFGLMFVLAGFWKLLAIGISGHAGTLAAQSARLGQKAIADDAQRVVQSIVQLSDSVNTLLRTSAGIGAFLIFVGFVFLTASYSIVFVLK